MGKVVLNNQQRQIASNILQAISDGSQVLAFITGRAGTGKSLLIKYICRRAVSLGAKTLNCAMTNRAAVKIAGRTLHSGMGWNVKRRKLNPAAPAHFATLIIVDEVSMMSSAILHDMHIQLSRGKPDTLFGGKSIVLVGDFNQLPPVRAIVAYRSYLWDEFRPHCHALTQNMRQQNEDFDAACLNYIQTGAVSPILSSRITQTDIETLTRQLPSLFDTMFLFYKNADVDEQNLRVARILGLEAVKQKSLITAQKKPANFAEVEDTLYIGARYTATETWNGITKGDVYTLVRVSARGATLQDTKHATIEICQRPIPYFLRGDAATKRTLPLRLFFASTVHMAQGASFNNVVVDPANMGRQLFYVAISRCRTADGLTILGSIPQQAYGWLEIQNEIFGTA